VITAGVDTRAELTLNYERGLRRRYTFSTGKLKLSEITSVYKENLCDNDNDVYLTLVTSNS